MNFASVQAGLLAVVVLAGVGNELPAAAAAAPAAVPAAPAAQVAPQPADAFLDRIRRHCGQAFAGRIVTDTPPPTGEDPFAGKALVMHVRGCESNELRIPFHVGDDRSRTWILTRTATGLRLKHDHRHADGTPDPVTMYGGDTADTGSALRQEFPVDAASIALFELTGRAVSTTNTWAMEIEPGRRFLYELSRPNGRTFQVEFDLSRPVDPPPAPWGHEQDSGLKRVIANGAEFHYVESGAGEPLILLHGGQGDYRSVAPQAEALSRRYRVIAYSRRFHHPNDNKITPAYRSGHTDADDLAAFVETLGLDRVHLVGTSAGALAALLFAMEHPDKVRSLVLAEPPIHSWARDDVEGRPLYDTFMAEVWEPAGAAFARGDDAAGMRALVDGFAGAPRFDTLPPAARTVALQNARFFRAATASADPFLAVDKSRVAGLRMPILIVTGERTVPLHRFVNAELARVLPGAEQATIAGAGHGAAREKPREFNDAVLAFLERVATDEDGRGK